MLTLKHVEDFLDGIGLIYKIDFFSVEFLKFLDDLHK